jgi:hypothetical protein
VVRVRAPEIFQDSSFRISQILSHTIGCPWLLYANMLAIVQFSSKIHL